VNAKSATAKQRDWLADYFAKEVEPVLTPLGLDPARPFPRIQNKSLNFIVRLSGKDAFGRDAELAVVQVPRSLPRIIRLPQSSVSEQTHFVFLSTVISMFVAQLFSGMKVEGAWQFRVTRNSDLFVDDEEVDNLLRAVEGELAQRRYGAAVRLETSLDCPQDIADFLLRHFALDKDDLYQVNGPVNLNRLMAIYDLVERPDLKYPAFTPSVPKRLIAKEDISRSCARASCSCTIHSNPSRPSSIFYVRPRATPTCSRSSRHCIAQGRSRRSSTRSSTPRVPARK
jgi:polyphosphate kinase